MPVDTIMIMDIAIKMNIICVMVTKLAIIFQIKFVIINVI